jgi:phosphatidylserine/phosphatidylglycerophosphate/cardiolipin synthase-like enzyme
LDVTTFTETAADQLDRPVLEPGRNTWRCASADRLSLLIDGDGYFPRLASVLSQAKRSIFIIGWDFNPDIRLTPRDPEGPTIGALLRRLVEENEALDVRILVWGMGPVYSGKSLRMFGKMDWCDHERIDLRFDFTHPLRASHHQKIVVIDDRTAFVGGIDLTARRWDDRDHAIDNPLRRSPDGTAYGPVHDMQALVTGEVAKLLGDVARRRWKKSIGEDLQPLTAESLLPAAEAPWPDDLQPLLTHCPAGLALTEPVKWKGRRGHREAIRLTHDALRAASKHLYIETQYLASFGVARTLAKRLKEKDGPEIVVLVTRESHGFLERLMMGNNRNRLIRKLMRADRYGRLRIFYAVVPDGKGGEREVIVHSKLIIVDDRFLRIGSTNLNNRSEGLDTECDLAADTFTPEGRAAITALRNDLIAEHLATDPGNVARVIAETGSMVAAIDLLNTAPRGLRPFGIDITKGEVEALPGTAIVDPKRPFWPIPQILGGLRRLYWRLSPRRLF